MAKSNLAVIREEGNIAYLGRPLTEAQEEVKKQIEKLALGSKKNDYNFYLHFHSDVYSELGLYKNDVIYVTLPEYQNDRGCRGNEVLIRNGIVSLKIEVKGIGVKKKDHGEQEDSIYLGIGITLYQPKDTYGTLLDAFSWDQEVAEVFKELDYYNWKEFLEKISISYKIERAFKNKLRDIKHRILKKLKGNEQK